MCPSSTAPLTSSKSHRQVPSSLECQKMPPSLPQSLTVDFSAHLDDLKSLPFSSVLTLWCQVKLWPLCAPVSSMALETLYPSLPYVKSKHHVGRGGDWMDRGTHNQEFLSILNHYFLLIPSFRYSFPSFQPFSLISLYSLIFILISS